MPTLAARPPHHHLQPSGRAREDRGAPNRGVQWSQEVAGRCDAPQVPPAHAGLATQAHGEHATASWHGEPLLGVGGGGVRVMLLAHSPQMTMGSIV